eukprot:m.307087 g.307087  ORF g.307087 m.307087 type:complete len:412 (+) comp41886_c0_seq1:436-1671(+)
MEDVIAIIQGIQQKLPAVDQIGSLVADLNDRVVEIRRTQTTERVDETTVKLQGRLRDKDLLCSSLSKEIEEHQAVISKLARKYGVSDEMLREMMSESCFQSLPSRTENRESMASASMLSQTSYSSVSSSSLDPSSASSSLTASGVPSSSIIYPPDAKLSSRCLPLAKEEAEVLHLRNEVKRLTEQLMKLVEVNKNWKKEYKEMEARKDARIAEQQVALERIKTNREQTDDVRRAAIAAEAMVSNMERERDDALRELDAVKSQLEISKAELEGSQKQLNSVLDRHEQEERTNSENIERLKQRLRQTSAARKEMEVELRTLHGEVEGLRRQNQSYESKWSHLRQGLHSLMFLDDSAPTEPKHFSGRTQSSIETRKEKRSVLQKQGLTPRGTEQFADLLGELELPSNVTIDENP